MMDLNYDSKESRAIRISITDDSNKEIAHAYIFLIINDLHHRPYALLEDVFVSEKSRGQGFGRQLVQAAIQKARELNCYKIIGTSRNQREKVHNFYELLNFQKHGFEFRMNL